jgi:hypothetical protein
LDDDLQDRKREYDEGLKCDGILANADKITNEATSDYISWDLLYIGINNYCSCKAERKGRILYVDADTPTLIENIVSEGMTQRASCSLSLSRVGNHTTG